MKRCLVVLLFALIATSASGQEFRARVTEVLSGETVIVRDFTGVEATVHLAGIDVPWRFRPYAARSRESLRELVKHKQVIVAVRRGYGQRLSGTIYIDDRDVALEQLRRGMAWYDRGEADIAEYAAAEEEAQRQRVGMWSKDRD